MLTNSKKSHLFHHITPFCLFYKINPNCRFYKENVKFEPFKEIGGQTANFLNNSKTLNLRQKIQQIPNQISSTHWDLRSKSAPQIPHNKWDRLGFLQESKGERERRDYRVDVPASAFDFWLKLSQQKKKKKSHKAETLMRFRKGQGEPWANEFLQRATFPLNFEIYTPQEYLVAYLHICPCRGLIFSSVDKAFLYFDFNNKYLQYVKYEKFF